MEVGDNQNQFREDVMTRSRIGAAARGCTLALMLLGAAPALAWDRGNVQVLTVLPNLTSGVPSSVEGLAVGPDGNIYVPSFGFNTTGATTGPANLFVISPSGKLIRQVVLNGTPAASPNMLGLEFNPINDHLFVLDFGSGQATGTANVLDVDPETGSFSVFATVPTITSARPGINGLTFDKNGNLYVSDSFQGIIWTAPATCDPSPCTMTPWVTSSLLSPGSGLTPPFGANGIEFNNDYSAMYVADTAFHQLIQIPVSASSGNGPLTPGMPSILITGINAPDGIRVDRQGNIWVCANQEDEMVVIDPKAKNPITGKTLPKVIAKLGDFDGIDQNGIAQGFLFPASPAFSPDGTTLYVSNLTLYLPYAGADAAIDSDWTLQVKAYTVSKISTSIPPISGGKSGD
jgi:sugar lactone lactonase YvrE